VIAAYLGKRAAKAAAGHTPIELMGGPRHDRAAAQDRASRSPLRRPDRRLRRVAGSARRQRRGAARLQWRRQDHDAQRHRRPDSGAFRIDPFRGEEIGGESAFSIVRKGLALSPEGWRLFVQQSVENNLLLGATPLRDKRARGAARARLRNLSKA
jgi:hypothetical protein